ncbi:hypothetical protein EVAR_4015_1 [Eumeta japonica]|uniref:Uncharacterized protein n=1 Tax=Eumeta variegata TaxID=151549 RepID=A0A4C1T6B5_EUMVA|nr:hypothetical protein EVAR_4015_1 [Eumeta japonica]
MVIGLWMLAAADGHAALPSRSRRRASCRVLSTKHEVRPAVARVAQLRSIVEHAHKLGTTDSGMYESLATTSWIKYMKYTHSISV